MQSHRWLVVLGLWFFSFSHAVAFSLNPEPPPAPPQEPAKTQAPAATPPPATGSSSSHGNRKHSHAHDFLIRGTVFTEKSLAFPGAKLRIRRVAEKKFRWETYTNSRGEFALRVPQGGEYEIVVIAKGFADQTNPVSAKSGISEDNVFYRMQPASGGKK